MRVEEEVEEWGVRGVRGLLENGRWGPGGVGRLAVAVAPARVALVLGLRS